VYGNVFFNLITIKISAVSKKVIPLHLWVMNKTFQHTWGQQQYSGLCSQRCCWNTFKFTSYSIQNLSNIGKH
jgi:hypothetical protein